MSLELKFNKERQGPRNIRKREREGIGIQERNRMREGIRTSDRKPQREGNTNAKCVGQKTESGGIKTLEQFRLRDAESVHSGGGRQTTEAEEIKRERSGGRISS